MVQCRCSSSSGHGPAPALVAARLNRCQLIQEGYFVYENDGFNEYGLIAHDLDEDVVLLEEEGGKSKKVRVKTVAKSSREGNGKAETSKKRKQRFVEVKEWDQAANEKIEEEAESECEIQGEVKGCHGDVADELFDHNTEGATKVLHQEQDQKN